MEDDAMPVLRMDENAPTARERRNSACILIHINLKAAAKAMTVIAKLTQGPQSMAPTMMTIAKSGKNDRPTINPACDRKACDRRFKLRSFL